MTHYRLIYQDEYGLQHLTGKAPNRWTIEHLKRYYRLSGFKLIGVIRVKPKPVWNNGRIPVRIVKKETNS